MSDQPFNKSSQRATLRAAIDREISGTPLSSLISASEELSENYRLSSRSPDGRIIHNDHHRLAYLATRMPATFEAGSAVLREIFRQTPGIGVHSLLDLGSGPGTMAWAAIEIFPELEALTLIERDAGLISIGRRMGKGTPIESSLWRQMDISRSPELPESDLVVASYSIGELDEKARKSVYMSMLGAARIIGVIIEPGTGRGFGMIREARSFFIEKGAWIIAPCPHKLECPMTDGDWCHFSARVERSSIHRRLKSGTMGYEDEKYSYLAFAKEPAVKAVSRILRHPGIHPGFIDLTLCTENGIEKKTITKSNPLWKTARKAKWGDEW